MKKLLLFALISLPLFLIFIFQFSIFNFRTVPYSLSDELDDVSKKLSDEQKRLADLEARKQQLARDIASASSSLASLERELSEAEAELASISAALAEKEVLLAEWERTRDFLIRSSYKLSRVSSFDIILSSEDFADATKQAYYHEKSLEDLREKIRVLSAEIVVFRQNKAQAEKLRNELADLKNQYLAILSARRASLSFTNSQLSSVKQSIKGLTARQEQLILEKFAKTSQSGTVGDKEPISTPLPAPSFSPAFAFATYGYPHRVGMNQYGAYGRSKAGQNYAQILSAYYNGIPLSGACDKSARIRVNGYFTDINGDGVDDGILLEDEYLKGIGEMPASWGNPENGGMEALKAQVVAARSYALDHVAKKGSICTTQACQVFLGKGAKNGTPWETAVEATCGQILTSNGAPISAYYASTAGGYTLSSQEVWGGYRAWAVGIKDFGPNGAYDGPAYGNSPWYHKAWGDRDPKTGPAYDPWLMEEETTDIFNALLLSKYSSSYDQYLSPIDQGGWGFDRIKQELRNLGISPVEKISALITTSDDKGHTASVLVCQPSGNPYPCGSPLTYSGKDFRAMFNLRARGSLVIWTSLYDLIRP